MVLKFLILSLSLSCKRQMVVKSFEKRIKWRFFNDFDQNVKNVAPRRVVATRLHQKQAIFAYKLYKMNIKHIISAIVFASLMAAGCGRQEAHNHAAHDHEDGHQHAENELHAGPEDEHGEEHSSDEIHLDSLTAARMGVKTMKVVAGPFSEVVKTFGEILPSPQSVGVVTAPTAGRVTIAGHIREGVKVGRGATIATVNGGSIAGGDVNAANQIALKTAKSELDRLTPLYEAKIVTASEYNAAVQAYELAKNAARGGGGGVATSPVAGSITSIVVANGQYVNAGDPIANVSNVEMLTLRADVPNRLADKALAAKSANFKLAENGRLFSTTSKASTTTSSVTKGYVPVYFNVENIGGLIPGSFADVYLKGAERQNVLTVPVTAIIERQGIDFVYVRSGHCYKRRPVKTGAGDGQSIEIVDGLDDGDEVVAQGAEYVRLAETQGAVPQGHSHNH